MEYLCHTNERQSPPAIDCKVLYYLIDWSLNTLQKPFYLFYSEFRTDSE